MLLCELLHPLYYSFSSCNFDPICNIVIYFLLVLNFATVICVLSMNVKLYKKNNQKTTTTTNTRFQIKMGKIYTRFRTEKAQKLYSLGN